MSSNCVCNHTHNWQIDSHFAAVQFCWSLECIISDRIGLHSVLLPLLITRSEVNTARYFSLQFSDELFLYRVCLICVWILKKQFITMSIANLCWKILVRYLVFSFFSNCFEFKFVLDQYWPFPPWRDMIQGWYCKEKLDSNYT